MALPAGARLGPYEILSLIGAGGMGEVYRARDDRLGRDVAIKVLPPRFAEQPDRVRRFEREARLIGALNHPNILAVYDVGTHQGTAYLVSELLDGETLRKRLAAGALPSRKAVAYAIQTSRGLAAAHGKGISHRDLKPENLFVTRDGLVKILDFGLAKAAEAPVAGETAATAAEGTEPGVVLGTAGYMAPEQVRGQPADHRSDVFSLGAVLYEMLSGRRAFPGSSTVEAMNAILKEDPAPLALPGVPAPLERIVRRCLEKDADDRFQSSRDLVFALEDSEALAPPPAVSSPPRPRAAWIITAAIVGLAAGAALWAWLRPVEPAVTPIVRALTHSGHDSSPAASADGRFIAFTSDRDGRPRIWIKELAGGGEQALTAGPDDQARFTPDGSSILFVRTEGGRDSLYRTAIVSGEPRKVLDDAVSGDWSPDGRRIAFLRWKETAPNAGTALGIVDASGGAPQEIAHVKGKRLFGVRWSPDGATLAAVETVQGLTTPQSIVLADIENRTVRSVPRSAYGFGISPVAWAGPDDVLYLQQADLVGLLRNTVGLLIRHNLRTGAAREILWTPGGGAMVDIAGPGLVVFGTQSTRQTLRELPLGATRGRPGFEPRWLTRGTGTDRQPVYPPDGEEIVFSSTRGGHLDLWSISVATGAVRRLTDHPAEDFDPAFTADGKHIIWSSNRTGHFEIWMGNRDGSDARQVTRDGVDAENATATRDGQWIVYASSNPAHQGLWKIRPDGSQATLLAPGDCNLPEVSPDGQFAVCNSVTAGGHVLLKVRRVADGAPAPFEIALLVRDAKAGASVGRSRWIPDGRALVFVAQDERGFLGVYAQDFVPGQDTTRTRRPLAGFERDMAVESFGISSDGSRMTVSVWDQMFSLSVAERVPGVMPPARPTRAAR